MTKWGATVIWVSTCVLVALGIVCKAQWLSDDNHFLNEFVGTSLITVVGVLATIGLSIAGNLHLELTRVDNEQDTPVFDDARRDLKHTGYGLAAMLFVSVIVAVAKQPLATLFPNWGAHAANGIALVLMVIVFLLVIDVTGAYFEYGPANSRD